MKKTAYTRRQFLGTSTLATAGVSLALAAPAPARAQGETPRPALLGGSPVRTQSFPAWPVYDQTEEQALLETLKSGHWFRGSGKAVAKFEDAFAEMTGAKYCVATSSGTAALTAALGALDIGPGDEVILPPYTFVATYNVVVLNHALPIFVDTDPESFQIDTTRIDAAITPDTKALLPVHIGGSPAQLDALAEIGRRHKIPVIEDACQAHLAEWRGRSVGRWGIGGCFSFQASKNLTSGEGGAVLTDDLDFAEACYRFHTPGRGRRYPGSEGKITVSGTRASNLRLAEFQGNLLRAQMSRVLAQTRRRSENAAYLSQLLREIPGLQPAKLYEGTTRSAFHLYMFRYDASRFAGLPRGRFLEALGREGIPASGGYGPMHRDDYVAGLAKNRHYLKVYGEARMQKWLEQARHCPENDRVCTEAVWFTQNLLLGPRSDMDQIADALRKIQRHAGDLAKAKA